MKKMFEDYKTMVVEPIKEFDEMYKSKFYFSLKEITLLCLAAQTVLICGGLIVNNRKKIKETIKSKFNRGKREIES